jgi:hypothetical protein
MAKKAGSNASTVMNSGLKVGLPEYISNYAVYIYLGLALLASWILFQDYLVGKYIYLFKDIGSDSVNFNYPQWMYLNEYWNTQTETGWSFRQGMGQNYYGVGPAFGFGLMGPFVLIISWFNPAQIPYLIIWFEVLKMVVGGLFFFYFLTVSGHKPLTSITGGLLFAFSGYMVLGSGWTGFSMEALAVAFLLFATEKLLSHKNYFWFSPALAYLVILQPFYLMPWGIFMFAYFLYRFYILHGLNYKELIRTVLILSGLSIIGLLMSAFYSVSVLQIMLESPRGGGESSYADMLSKQGLLDLYPSAAIHYLTVIYRLFSNDLVGGGLANFKGWNNYLEAPIFYGGLVTLLLFPQTLSRFREKEGIAFVFLFIAFLIPVIFPWFRFAFWGFTGDYYRTFSLCFVLVLLLGAMQALSLIEQTGKLNIAWLLGALGFWLLLLYFPFDLSKSILEKNIRSQVTLFLVLEGVSLFLLTRPQTRPYAIQLSLIVLLELIVLGLPTANKRDMVKGKELEARMAYNDYTREAMQFVENREKGFYRVAKDYASGPAYHSSLNDALIQGFMGTSCYYSFNQKYYIEFLTSVGLVDSKNEFSTRWAQGLNNRPLLLTMAASRYTLHKGGNPYLYGFGYDSLTLVQDVSVFRNRFALPFGVVYHQWISAKDFEGLSQFIKDKTMLSAIVLQENEMKFSEGMKPYPLADTAAQFTFELYQALTDSLKADSLALSSYSENALSGSVRSRGPGILMLPMSFDPGWKVKVNGAEGQLIKVHNGLSGVPLSAGNHTIELKYEVPYLGMARMASGVGLGIYLIGLIGLIVWNRKRREENKNLNHPE